MAASRPVLRVGLTGGIASGKSTVVGILADLGAFVLDADELARQVMAPGGSAYDEVVAHFGKGILDVEGRIDRGALARIVFQDERARQALNEIVHPRIRAEADRRIESSARAGRSPLVIFDAALLVETGAHRDFHRVVVVRCSRETQLRRLVERDGLSEEAARARIDAQAPAEEKVALAHYVIDTDGTLADTRERTRRVFSSLLDDHDRTFAPRSSS